MRARSIHGFPASFVLTEFLMHAAPVGPEQGIVVRRGRMHRSGRTTARAESVHKFFDGIPNFLTLCETRYCRKRDRREHNDIFRACHTC